MKIRTWWEIEVPDHHSPEEIGTALAESAKAAAQVINERVGPATIAVAVQPLTDNPEALEAGIDLPRLLPTDFVTNPAPEATNNEPQEGDPDGSVDPPGQLQQL